MKGVRAFTIIELSIAVAVAAIIGMAAVSRYSGYLQLQEFRSGGQQIANCLQRASHQVRAGSTANVPRFTRATITSYPGTPKVECIVEPYAAIQASDGTELLVSELLAGVPAEGVSGQPFRADNSILKTNAIVRVVFGALENGMPVGLSSAGIAIKQPDAPGATYVPLGRGFTLPEGTTTIQINSQSIDACGVISMTNLGLPVKFQELPETSC
ncbi:MAG TPA: prepilin-type N-terminal cleavage/methylation domain-containing protein [Verrucomicrobiae bacterium]|nr:prepilin-type N-terminal cleavage/methylation domain-containing protein [Verrucomicrobiae bacterium]